jgi:hypothetical protein
MIKTEVRHETSSSGRHNVQVSDLLGRRVKLWVECCSKSETVWRMSSCLLEKTCKQIETDTNHAFLEPFGYARPASGVTDPRSDVRGQRVSIRAAVEPKKLWVQRKFTDRHCDARGLENFGYDDEIARFRQVIGDVTKATAVPAPNIRTNENGAPGLAKGSRCINFSSSGYSDLGAFVVFGGG